MIKDVYEDYQRHKADNEENNLPYPVLKDGKFVEMKSADIRVGDIVKVMFFIVFCNWWRLIRISSFRVIWCLSRVRIQRDSAILKLKI